jgi:hypothetical protein
MFYLLILTIMKKMITLLLAALCCAQVSFACIYMGPYQKFIVQDRDSNLPLTGATITVLYQNKPVRQITLDSSGFFYTYLWAEDISYKLVIKHEGYIALSQSLHVSDENNMEIKVWLSPVKRARVLVREIERPRFRRQYALTPLQVEENRTKSINSDEAYHTMSCNMKHLNRKDETLMAKDGKQFNEVVVYPNPTVSGSQVYVESKFDESKLLVIYNLAGLEVLRTEIVYHTLIETSGLNPGLYILKVIDVKNDDVVTQKFLIQ